MKSFNEFYEDYWAKGLGAWSARNLALDAGETELIRKHSQSGQQVLDVGCGDGRIADFLASIGVWYTGVDISPSALETLTGRGHKTVVCDLGATLPFASDSFDLVLIFEVLEHLFRPDVCLQEVQRVLRMGGVLLGSVPNVAYFPNRLMMLAGMFNPGGSPTTSLKTPWKDPHVRFFTTASLKRLLEDGGLTNVRVIGQPFRLTNLPRLYRTAGNIRNGLDRVSRPFAFFGSCFPGLFSFRLFFTGQKS